MSTFVEVTVWDRRRSREEIELLVDKAFSLAAELERKFDLYCPSSELNRLNRQKTLKVSSSMMDVLLLAEKITLETGGDFDITVAPELARGGFYRDMPEELLDLIPDVSEERTGLTLDEEASVARISPETWLDLSGLAKGYIVDRMGRFFAEAKLDSYMINAGGDILCRSGKVKDSWKIGLRRPGSEHVELVFVLANGAVATSGDYEKYIVEEGTDRKELTHIIEPETGMPIPKRPASVTVIAPSCARADALATGLLVSYPSEAIRRAEELSDVEAVYVIVTPAGTEKHMTSGAARYISAGRSR